MLRSTRPLTTFVYNRVLAAPSQVETACTTCAVKRIPCGRWSTVSSTQRRDQHTAGRSFSLQDLSGWQKFKWDLGFYGKLQVPDRKLRPNAYNLYICCTDFIDFEEFFRELNLPDTFNSWFLLLQLHMWLLSVKLAQMGKEGELLKKYIYIAMWYDVEKRVQTFEDLHGREKGQALENLYSIMILSHWYYDEGLLGSDKTLANALWVQLFGMEEKTKAEHLEKMVEYVRKQVHYMDQLELYPIMNPGFVSFLPLHGDKVDQGKLDANLDTLLRRKIEIVFSRLVMNL